MKATKLLVIFLIVAKSPLTAQEVKSTNTDSLAKDVQSMKSELARLSRLKITGWVQVQFQYAQTRGAANFDGGNFAANSDKRFMIRRGRVKFTYNGDNSQYVMQINATERGVNLVEFFAVVTDPWIKTISLTAGVMNRPFGFEIEQSSAVRESPERSRYTQILMPNERDLGAKITIAPPKSSQLFGLRLDAGMYNGQGIYVPGTSTPPTYPPQTTPMLGVNEFDFQKDFIGRLCYYRTTKNEKYRYGAGMSHYRGGNMYQSNVVYDRIVTDSNQVKNWVMADSITHKYKNTTAPRIYYGAEVFFSINTLMGTTTLRGEYISGTQSGTSLSSASPFYLPVATDTYIRKFNGMYAYFIHRFWKSKHEIAVKYEWYDPNTKVKGNDILGAGNNNLTVADIRYDQLGFGYNFLMSDNLKFMFFYNIISNESTGDGVNGLVGYKKDIKDNILTIRMQYKF